ncbi:MAG: TrmH family RNA methyltransferase [Acidobacteria bacterium]|nr:TrmH family RNA methyltransferase [Acidobacteriota bacterium]
MTRSLGGTELKRLHRDWRRRTDDRLALLLDGVQNPFNVGAIMRTAAAYSVEQMWLVGAPSPNDTKVNKTALGSQRFITWTTCETTAEAIASIRAAGYRLLGIELAESARPLHELDLHGDVCLALGHEDRGLSKELLADNDGLGYIPQTGRIGSLNVGTAAAIACYEARRAGWSTER